MTFTTRDSVDQPYGVWAETFTESFATPADAAQNTAALDAQGYIDAIFYLKNTTEKSVVFTLRRCKDAAKVEPEAVAGCTVTLTDGSTTATTAKFYVSDPGPFFYVSVDPAGNATVGAASIAAFVRKGGGV